MNLFEYVLEPFTENAHIDIVGFKHDVQTCVKALDDVLEEGKDLHALEEQREMANNYRNIGLGLMGVASALMALGISYGSNESFTIIEEVSRTMFYSALEKSALLAKEKGAFPKCNIESIVKSNILKETEVPNSIIDLIKQYGLRNCSLLSIAPSGSIGTMLNVSTGLEPYYALKYNRKTESLHGNKDVYYEVEVDIAKQAREAFGVKPCVSALNIDWKDRVKLQGVMQFYVDTAISSTVNVKEDITVDELRDLYLYSWKKGLKGITIYRENSFQAILSTEPKKENEGILDRGTMAKVPEDTIYYPREMNHGCGKAKVMVGYSPSENRITDVYHIEKGMGGCAKNTQGEAILISQVLRLGGNLEDIKKSFGGIGACTSCTISRMKGKKVDGVNCPNILLKIVLDAKKELVDKNELSIEHKKQETKSEIVDNKYICPECGNILHPEGACFTCIECGYSKCE